MNPVTEPIWQLGGWKRSTVSTETQEDVGESSSATGQGGAEEGKHKIVVN